MYCRLLNFLLVSMLSFIATSVSAQNTNERDHLRMGNRLYNDSLYAKAEVEYRKAIEKNPQYAHAHYNLGNTLVMQGKPKEAMQAYEDAVKYEKNKSRLSQNYHNMGVILQSQKQFAPAIDCYKNALRNNPSDHQTRYNLALCQHQLKNQPQDNKQDNKDQNQDKQEEKQQEQQEQQQQKQQEENKEQQQQENNISKENAEQLLKAVMEDEKKTQEKVNKAMQQPRRRRLEKQW